MITKFKLFEQYDNKNMIPGNIYKMEDMDNPYLCFIEDNSMNSNIGVYGVIIVDMKNNFYTIIEWEKNRKIYSTNMTLKDLIMENKIDLKKLENDFYYAMNYADNKNFGDIVKKFHNDYIENDVDIKRKIKSNEFNL